MSALTPKADMCSATWDVRFVPLADSCSAEKKSLFEDARNRFVSYQSASHLLRQDNSAANERRI
jgi:hypothetical protein